MNKDIRWIQRFNNFKQALKQLNNVMELLATRELTELEKQGVVQAFEYNHELAWKVLKDFYEYQGTQGLQGGRDAVREAFNKGLIEQDNIWLDMIKKRNLTVHTCNKATTDKIVEAIVHDYYPEFIKLKQKLDKLLDE